MQMLPVHALFLCIIQLSRPRVTCHFVSHQLPKKLTYYLKSSTYYTLHMFKLVKNLPIYSTTDIFAYTNSALEFFVSLSIRPGFSVILLEHFLPKLKLLFLIQPFNLNLFSIQYHSYNYLFTLKPKFLT